MREVLVELFVASVDTLSVDSLVASLLIHQVSRTFFNTLIKTEAVLRNITTEIQGNAISTTEFTSDA